MTTLAEFRAALDQADPEAFCNPPGLGRGFKVKHIRSGLARRVLVEYDGIIAFARNPKHGVCDGCRGKRDSCTHCNCSTCVWEREVDGHGGPKATPEQMARLRAQIAAFRFAPQREASAVRLDGEE